MFSDWLNIVIFIAWYASGFASFKFWWEKQGFLIEKEDWVFATFVSFLGLLTFLIGAYVTRAITHPSFFKK